MTCGKFQLVQKTVAKLKLNAMTPSKLQLNQKNMGKLKLNQMTHGKAYLTEFFFVLNLILNQMNCERTQ
jgi:hypothetical protein